MSTIYFCGATGKCFGRWTAQTMWLYCSEPEKPERPNCMRCKLYLAGRRLNNSTPYWYAIWDKWGKNIAVAGGGIDKAVLLANRLECGRHVWLLQEEIDKQ